MKSGLPNSSQFSPIQTPLPALLLLVRERQPDRQSVRQGIADGFFAKSKDALDLANNTIFAMSEYGLLHKPVEDQAHASLTPLGEELAAKAAAADELGLYAEFAKHILLHLRGLELIACANDLLAAGQSPTKALLVKELKIRGIYHPPNGTHANGMRQWLEQAGVVNKGGWNSDARVFESLLGGVSSDDLDAFAGLTIEQRAFAKAFARLNVEQARSNEVAAYASALFGVEFPEGGLPQSTLFALRDAGLLECEKTTGGQGAKPYIVRPTVKLKNDVIEPLLESLENAVGVQYRSLVRKPLTEILTELKADSTHVKGRGLEALAFYLARLLDLTFVKWRLRSEKTGGSEIDVIMEGTQLIFSRWQIQCKNSAQASLEDIAKEVGIAQLTKANVILIVTTGKIGQAARRFAESVMRETALYIVLLDGKDLKRLQQTPADIVEIFSTQAVGAMQLKRPQVEL